MAATFSYKIDGVRTGTIGNLTDVIKQVNFTLIGTEEGVSFSLPGQVKLDDPNPTNFIQFNNLTEQQVADWIDVKDEVFPMKNHIQFVLDKKVLESKLTEKPMPWAPPPSPSPEV